MMKTDHPYLKELESTITFHIHRLSHLISRQGAVKMREEGLPIDMDQLPVLMCVFLGGGITQQEIATVSDRDKASVKRTLTVLEKRGLINVRPHSEDKRKTIVQTTDAGNYIAGRIREMVRLSEQELFSFLSDKARNELLSKLQLILNKIELERDDA